MNYTLVILSGPDSGQCHARALAFGHALERRGHHLSRVFFFGQGVRVALDWDDGAAKSWQQVASSANVELVLCSASAERYGVATNHENFVIAGLGSLMEAGFDSDRVLTFA